MKICITCKAEKELDDFWAHSGTKDKKQKTCKQCNRSRQKQYRADRKKNGQESYSQENRLRLKMEVLRHYSDPSGPVCDCCKESKQEFLCIDHIDGGGVAHRKELGGTSIYQWLKRSKYPKGFRVLCHNCNQSYGAYGYCPHQDCERRTEKTPISTQVQDAILLAAQSLADEGQYPSTPKVAARSGKQQSMVMRHKQLLMAENRWPMQEQAEEMAKRYRPDRQENQNGKEEKGDSTGNAGNYVR